ncbi:DUF4123 domain-containing protein [Halomonas dongshanensis]|uniref:DUF4123 domain-containing protein n=1 Tax=Halomonas dongshanensis TaxID=2890835 RepID=A0ABT2ECJ9_9GAMM|nr:DUF4123 domain-containing protein [Halomonas dongshanensis]MCS2609270.1 DUF4123 domain-containing protein [Halomonas dongshanensis]
MSPPDYWVARCHVAALSPQARRWEETADEAVMSVAVLAHDEEDVRQHLQRRLHDDGLALLRLDAVETLLQRFRHQGMAQTLVEMAHATTEREPVVYGELVPLLPDPEPEIVEPIIPPVSYAETTWDALFGPHQPPLWAVVDGINCREARQRLLASDAQHACLYAATDAATQTNAPWLVRIEADSDIRAWLENLPHDQHWGILLQSTATLKQLRLHLRKFTMLWTPANAQAPVYFRFYDPRVALDMSQALEPWKLAAFMAPLRSIIVPASPLMVFPSDLTLAPPVELDTPASEIQGRLTQVSLSEQAREACRHRRQFAVGQDEFARFGALMQQRAQAALALSMTPQYPQKTAQQLLSAVHTAVQLGQRYSLASKKQTRTLTTCVLEFGNHFPAQQDEARQILENPKLAAWRKRDRLEAWLPRGRVYHALRPPYSSDEEAMQQDNFRPIVNEGQS